MRKSYKLWLFGFAALVLLSAAAAPWTFHDEPIRKRLVEQIQNATGLKTQFSEPVTIALLPQPHIKIKSVRITDAWKNLSVDVQILKADLRLASLLSGKIEVSSLALYLPTIVMNVHSRPLNERGAIAEASNAPKASKEARATDSSPLGTVRIFGGRLLLKSSSSSPASQIGDINATLDWRSIQSPAHFDGDFIWRGEKVHLTTAIGQPGELLRAGSSPFKLNLTSRLLNAKLDGKMSTGRGWQYLGALEASSPALRSLVSVTGAQWPPIGSITEISVKGAANIRPRSAVLTELMMRVDGNAFDGALAIHAKDGGVLVAGTLATESLTIDNRSANLPHLTIAGGKWNTDQLPVELLELADLDIRMSARQATFNRISASDVAIVATLRNKKLELSVSSSSIYNGSIRSKFSIEKGPALPAVGGTISFNSVDMGAFLRGAFRNQRLTGAASGTLNFKSAGSSFADIAGLLSGNVAAELSKGEIRGIDLVEGMQLARNLPLSIPDRIRQGATPIEKAVTAATIKDGTLYLGATSIDSGVIHSTVSGSIKLPTRHLNLTISTIHKPDLLKNGEKSLTLELDVAGAWNGPAIIPNPESLIRRSKAAEPLLRTIRKLRDAAATAGPANREAEKP